MPYSLNSLDLLWAAAGVAGCLYPLWRVREHALDEGAFDFIVMMVAMGFYPTALALFHLTPFDLGLSYAFVVFMPTVFFFAMGRYLGIRFERQKSVRATLYSLSCLFGLMALTNPWHGQFAVFQPHVPGQPNHLLVQDELRMGMLGLFAFSTVLVATPIVMTLVQFMKARFSWTIMLIGVVLPALGLWSGLFAERPQRLFGYEVSGFLVASTLILISTNFSIVIQRFVEFRMVTRSKILAVLPEAMVVLTPQRHVLDCNPAFEDLLQRDESTILGQPLVELLPELDVDRINVDGEFEVQLGSTSANRWYRVNAKSMDANVADETQIVLLLHDVTERRLAHEALQRSELELREANESLQWLSVTDALTGLKNRRFFQEQLQLAMDEFRDDGRQLGLISIDVDHFKRINDTHGHAVGDNALEHVADVLDAQSRDVDTLARLGGEEFMLLVQDASLDELYAVANRMRLRLEESSLTLGARPPLVITASFGLSCSAPGDTADELLRRADNALYLAKRKGRNRIEREVTPSAASGGGAPATHQASSVSWLRATAAANRSR